MKKTLTFVLLTALAVSSQAGTINWGNSGATSGIYALDGVTKLTQVTGPAASFAITLMYLGSGYPASYPGVVAVDTAAVPTVASISKTNGQLQNANDKYVFGSNYTTGDQFFIVATATFGGQDYYMEVFKNNVYGTTWAIAATSDVINDTFSWTAGSYGGAGVEGQSGKWIAVPVPEPATAALAIAGIAMLIRRRRA